jgi:hypothetical protein
MVTKQTYGPCVSTVKKYTLWRYIYRLHFLKNSSGIELISYLLFFGETDTSLRFPGFIIPIVLTTQNCPGQECG